ncbi:MAG: endonuclease VIII [Rhodothermales bacterium]
MPEGPEVRHHADALHDALAGRPLRDVAARTKKAKAWLAQHPEAFVGQTVEQVIAHGKHLIGFVTGDLYFHSHLMMWGRWQVVPPDDERVANRDRRERARLVTDDAVALLYSAPIFEVGRGNPYAQDTRLGSLGPNALSYGAPFDVEAFLNRLLCPEQFERTLGAVLLDQRIVAGIGNYLRADILFACRLDPWKRVAELTDADLDCLCRTVPMITERSYQHGRTVTADEQERQRTDPDLIYSTPADWNTRHYVFRRTNLPCLVCGDIIRQKHQHTATTADGEEKKRIIYFCPTCQNTSVELKPPRKRAKRNRPAEVPA